VYKAANVAGIPLPLAIIGAVGAAVAIEAVGMSAGKDAVRFTVAGHWLAVPSWLSLFAYTAIGMYELWGSVFAFAFLFSFLAYVNDGIGAIWERNVAEKATGKADGKAARSAQIDADQQAQREAAERAQDIALAELAAKERVQLAKIAAQSAAVIPQPAAQLAPPAAQSAAARRKPTLTAQERAHIAGISTAEVQTLYNVSERTAQSWRGEFQQLTQTSAEVSAD
jgi:Na+-transporting methylmalonyl-CoA/oxaloacetate decarboxylase gamma subunit